MQHTKQSVTRSCRSHVTTVGSAVFERPPCESSPTRQRIMVPVRHLAIAGRCHTFASHSWLWHSHQGAPRARGLLIPIREAHAKDRSINLSVQVSHLRRTTHPILQNRLLRPSRQDVSLPSNASWSTSHVLWSTFHATGQRHVWIDTIQVRYSGWRSSYGRCCSYWISFRPA